MFTQLGVGLGILRAPLIKPQGNRALAFDFTGTSLPSQFTQERSGLAGMWQDDGTLGFGPHNSWLRSQEFDHTSWTKTQCSVVADAITGPFGAMVADKLVEDNTTNSHYLNQNVVTTNGLWTIRLYAKAAGRSWVALGINDSGPALRRVWFNVSAGTVGTTDAGLTAAIADVGDGWFRLTATMANAFAGAGNVRIHLSNGDGVASYAGDGSSGVYLASGRVVRGTMVSDIETTTTARYLLRQPLHPSLSKRGVALQRQFNQRVYNATWPSGLTGWTQTGSPTRVASIHGDGDDASAVEFAASASQVYITRSQTINGATECVMSVEVESVSGTIQNQDVMNFGTLPSGCSIFGWRVNGATANGTDQVVVGLLEVVIGGTYSGAAADLHFGAGITGAVTATVRLSRPQLTEAGDIGSTLNSVWSPLSWISNPGTTVLTETADPILTYTLPVGLQTALATAGTIAIEFGVPNGYGGNSLARSFLTLSDGTANNRIMITKFSDSSFGVYCHQGGGSAKYDRTLNVTPFTAAMRIAFTWGPATRRGCVNGTLLATLGTFVGCPVTTLAVGGAESGSAIADAIVHRVMVDTRTYDDTELQAIFA